MTATWGVAALVKADEPWLERFVAHHLALGAARVSLCFDDPGDPAFDRFAAMAGVEAVRCDEAFWRGRRPERPFDRQVAAFRHVHERSRLDWLAHLDHDEAIDARRPIARVLSRLPKNAAMLVMRPMERIFDADPPAGPCFAGWYRSRADGPGAALARRFAYGRWAARLNEHGFLSHRMGKSFFRVSARLRPKVHFCEEVGEIRVARRKALRLLHVPFTSADDIRRRIRARAEDREKAARRVRFGHEGFHILGQHFRETGEDLSEEAWRRLGRLSSWRMRLLAMSGAAEWIEADIALSRNRKRSG